MAPTKAFGMVGESVDTMAGRERAVGASLSAALTKSTRENCGEPPVVVLNLFYSGLGIARQMAGLGVRVIGLSSQREAYGNFTRLCEVRFAPDSKEDPSALAEFLLQAAPELGGAVVFPTRDFDLLFLDRFREVLTPHYRMALPARQSLFQVLDKRLLAHIADKAGVPTPRTAVVSSGDEIDQAADEVGLPCVVKPVSSYQWREGGNWEKVGGRKAFLASSKAELRSGYHRVSAAHPRILVQEWIPGSTRNVVVLGAYVGEDATPLAYFTARKIAQYPDDFGTGCIVRNEEIGEIVEPSISLWRGLAYRGMAEVEYKYDARVGKYRLIEMNSRHWDQHELGCAAGVNLTWTAYCDLVGLKPAFVPSPTERAVWIAEDSLCMVLLDAIRRGLKRRLELRQLLSGHRIYGIFSWRDPKPFVHYSFRMALPRLVRGLWGRAKRGTRLDP